MHALCNTKSYKPGIFLPVGKARWSCLAGCLAGCLSVCPSTRNEGRVSTSRCERVPAQAVLCLNYSPQNKRAPGWHLDGFLLLARYRSARWPHDRHHGRQAANDSLVLDSAVACILG